MSYLPIAVFLTRRGGLGVSQTMLLDLFVAVVERRVITFVLAVVVMIVMFGSPLSEVCSGVEGPRGGVFSVGCIITQCRASNKAQSRLRVRLMTQMACRRTWLLEVGLQMQGVEIQGLVCEWVLMSQSDARRGLRK